MSLRIVGALVAVTLVVLIALEVPLAVTFEQQRTTEASTELERDALAIGDLVEDDLEAGESTTLDEVVRQYEAERGARAVIVDPTGVALADSDPTAEVGESVGRSFADRPEIAQALAGEVSLVTRYSETLGETLQIVAAPVRSGGRVLGAVRVSRSRAEIDEEVRRYQLALGAIAVLSLLGCIGLGYAVGRWATGALAGLQRAASRLERGDLDSRAPTGVGPPEVQDLAASFNAMAERLGTLVRSSQDFAVDASHQLRTPLTAVRLRLDNLAATSGDEEAVDAVLRDISRLDQTIDALLAFTRLERQPTQPTAIRIGDALHERAAVWSPTAEEDTVRVAVVEHHDLDERIEFDPNHLEQVIDNLVANAIEAAPSASTVELWARSRGDHVEIHVTDHGPGLSEEDRERAFDRHWGMRPGGTGLGLAIVERLCSHNRASVSLEETPGGGIDATVVVRRASGAPIGEPAS
jgi:signal transduction histidine kinase